MNKSLWNKKIPGFFGIIFILLGVALTVFLVRQGVVFFTQASPSEIPQEIEITNVSDSSFSITYFTDKSVVGSINFGENDVSEQTALDDRDQLSETLTPYETHSITARNLKSGVTYKYSILSGTSEIKNDEVFFEITTAQPIDENPSTQKPVAGKVLTPDGEPSPHTIVYLSLEGSQTISTLTKSDGSYILPINSLRTKDLSRYYKFDADSILNINFTNGKQNSSALISINEIDPVPTVTLTNNYDFSIQKDPISSQSATPADNFPESEENEQGTAPVIETPVQDQSFTDAQPEFSGTALPNEEIEIEIHSDENIKVKVATDNAGNWEYRPDKPLSPGEHTIIIRTKTTSGIVNTITRRFTVFAAGSQVNESATPSASLTPTVIPSSSPSPTPSIAEMPETIATPTPTIVPTGPEEILSIAFIGLTLSIFGIAIFLFTRYKIPL